MRRKPSNGVMSNTEKLLLRGSEVADLLGCSRAAVYRLMQRGVIPVVRVPGGRTVRVPRTALEQWITANTQVTPNSPIEHPANNLR